MSHWTRISGYITIYPGQFDQFITDKFYELEDDEAKDWEVTNVDFDVADYIFSLFKANYRNWDADMHMLLGDQALLELKHKETGQYGYHALYLTDILPKDSEENLVRLAIKWPAGTEGPLNLTILPTSNMQGWIIVLQGALRNYELEQFVTWWEAIKQLFPADAYCVQARDNIKSKQPYVDIKHENFD